MRGKSFRFVTTHLETFSPIVQVTQANELLSPTGPVNTVLPVLLVGDFNSSATKEGLDQTPTYGNLIAAGLVDAWTLAGLGQPRTTSIGRSRKEVGQGAQTYTNEANPHPGIPLAGALGHDAFGLRRRLGSCKRIATPSPTAAARSGLPSAWGSISDGHVAGAGVRIVRIEDGRIQARDRRADKAVWLAPGDPVPGFPDRFFVGTTFLSGLTYRYRIAEGSRDPEPKLLCIRASRALLEVTVPVPLEVGQMSAEGKMASPQAEAVASVGHPPKQGSGEAGQIVEVAPHTYQVGAKALQDLLDQGA